jgi:phosphomethylpyrimidine synthase
MVPDRCVISSKREEWTMKPTEAERTVGNVVDEQTGGVKPFPGSRKVYIQGSRPDIAVPEREIALHPTHTPQGTEHHEPLRVYDTSGPMTDEAYQVDIHQGLPPLRRAWALDRGVPSSRRITG